VQDREIFAVIEEVFRTQKTRDMQKLLDRDVEMSNEALHTLRGMAVATDAILRTLRNTLGYDPIGL